MPVRTKDQLKAELNTTFFENPGGGITPALVQTFMIDVIDSILDSAAPSPSLGAGSAAGLSLATAAGMALFLAAGTAAGSSSAVGASPSWIGPTWSLTDNGFQVAVSGTNNETITRTGGSGFWRGGRSNTGLVSGLRYVEFHVINNYPATGPALGFANGAASVDSQELSNNAFYFIGTGGTYYGGGFAGINGQMSSYAAGDVIGIEIDLDANTVRGRKNGGSWTSTEDITAMRGGINAPIFVYSLLNYNDASNFDQVTLGNM